MLNERKFDSLIISDGKVRRIDVFNSKANFKPILKSIDFDAEIITSVDYHGKTIAIYEKKNRLFKLYSTDFIFKSSFDGNFNLNCIKLYRDRWLCGGDNWGKIHIFDIHENSYKKSLSTYKNQTIIDIAISSDQNHIFACHENGKISIASKNNKKGHLFSWINESVNCFTSSPWKNSYLLTGSSDGVIGLYDTLTEKKIYHSCFHKNKVNCVSYSYYNENLALSADNNSLVLTTLNGKPQRIHKTKSPVTSCSMSDGVLYGFGEANGNISVFDIRNLKEPVYFLKTPNPIDYFQFCFLPFRKKADENLFDLFDLSAFVNNQQAGNFEDFESSCFSILEKSSRKIFSDSENLNLSYFSSSLDSLSSVSDCNSPIQQNSLSKSIETSNNYNCVNPSNIQQTYDSKEQIQSVNVSSLRQIIKSEIRLALESMENRIETSIISNISQQLYTSEQNIIKTISELLLEINNELQKENNALKDELNNLAFI